MFLNHSMETLISYEYYVVTVTKTLQKM